MENDPAVIASAAISVASVLISGAISYVVARSTSIGEIKAKDYTHLDSLYEKVLELYLLHPEFQDPKKTAEFEKAFKDEAVLYDAYATILHNFHESIFDRATVGDEIDPQWARIFDYHAKLHLRWLLNNDKPFEPTYCEFVRNRYRI
jgi:hypothetical protein